MGVLKKIPLLSILDVANTTRDLAIENEACLSLSLVVFPDANRAVVLQLRRLFKPLRAQTRVRIYAPATISAQTLKQSDIIIVLGSADPSSCYSEKKFLSDLALLTVPLAYIKQNSARDTSDTDFMDTLPAVQLFSEENPGLLQANLIAWLLNQESLSFLLAASFAPIREELVRRLSFDTAKQNALIGAVDIIHGSDFPLMSANQLKYALKLYPLYGKTYSYLLLLDLALVLCSGLVGRSFSRALTQKLPFPKSLMRASIAFLLSLGCSQILLLHHKSSIRNSFSKKKE